MSIIGELGRHRRRKVVELRVPVNPVELADRIGRGVYNLGVDLRREDISVGEPTTRKTTTARAPRTRDRSS